MFLEVGRTLELEATLPTVPPSRVLNEQKMGGKKQQLPDIWKIIKGHLDPILRYKHWSIKYTYIINKYT